MGFLWIVRLPVSVHAGHGWRLLLQGAPAGSPVLPENEAAEAGGRTGAPGTEKLVLWGSLNRGRLVFCWAAGLMGSCTGQGVGPHLRFATLGSR